MNNKGNLQKKSDSFFGFVEQLSDKYESGIELTSDELAEFMKAFEARCQNLGYNNDNLAISDLTKSLFPAIYTNHNFFTDISDDLFKTLAHALKSSKKEGMGLFGKFLNFERLIGVKHGSIHQFLYNPSFNLLKSNARDYLKLVKFIELYEDSTELLNDLEFASEQILNNQTQSFEDLRQNIFKTIKKENFLHNQYVSEYCFVVQNKAFTIVNCHNKQFSTKRVLSPVSVYYALDVDLSISSYVKNICDATA